jgi:hypothetical protein
MKPNMLAVVAICALAGVAVACKTAPHAMLGPLDFPQAEKGEIRWSSSDGNNYDIQFDNIHHPPCQEGSLLHVISGQITTCTVIGKGLLYTYTVTQVGANKETVATLKVRRAVIIPCHACGKVQTMLQRAGAVSIGAVVALGSDNPMTIVLQQECSSGNPNDACLYQGDSVEWQLNGDGTQLEVDFPQGNTPCADGTYQLLGKTTSPISLPMGCTTGTGAASTKTYTYTFKVDGATVPVDKPSTVTVMKAPAP